MTNNSILIVEDTMALAKIYEGYLREAHYEVMIAETGRRAMKTLDKLMPAAVILDLLLPDLNGLDVLDHCRRLYPAVPVIILTTHEAADGAIEAVQHGAYDYILKPFPAARLILTLEHAMEQKKLTNEVSEWRQLVGQGQFQNFIGYSPVMQAVYRAIESVADSKISVFIFGESGTGKELAAQAIHSAGKRRLKPFAIMNCAATSHDLIETTLFGYTKGAFPGAVDNQPGTIRNADGGTLFLKEICEMPLNIQEKLIRFLQSGEVAPVGSTTPEAADVRIIASTCRKPSEEIENNRLSEDLYRHLQVLSIEMPPLRDRDNDILLLANHFMTRFNTEEGKRFGNLAPEVMHAFRCSEWPGNVRQMENVIRSIVMENEGSTIVDRMLPQDLKKFGREGKITSDDSNPHDLMLVDFKPSKEVSPLWVMEMETILQALEYTRHDIGKAASLLEVSPSTLYRKIKMWQNPDDLISKPAMTA